MSQAQQIEGRTMIDWNNSMCSVHQHVRVAKMKKKTVQWYVFEHTFKFRKSFEEMFFIR